MANIRRIEGKTGVSFKITVSQGRDSRGKQIRHYLTWTPEAGMTEKQMGKAVAKAAFEFEQQINQGFEADNRQTFEQYAQYALSVKEREGCKRRTLDRYRELLKRINPAIGHLKLLDIRPQHLNTFYIDLSKPGVSLDTDTATALPTLAQAIPSRSKAALARASGLSATTITTACRGLPVSLATAGAIAAALGCKTETLFHINISNKALSAKTILEHHRLIRTILAQAEKEMLVPYNAASKATPPKVLHTEVNYFQAQDVADIRQALEQEPLKWRTIVYLLLITGCRRGEIMGLKWEKIDLEARRIKIDTALLYSPQHGIYEDTTKTGNQRYINIPREVADLLKQYRREYMEMKLRYGDRWKDTGYLFVKDDGTPMIPDSITAWLRKFSKKHGLMHINPHAFRHTMASILISTGQDIVSVSKRLGHAKVSTTTDFYSHIIQEADQKASDRLGDVLLHNDIKRKAAL